MAKPGTFQKGDGRRRGPPPLPAEVRDAFRAASAQALETLLSVMKRFGEGDEDVPASAAVSAATAILDRAWGKPQSAPEDLDALKRHRPLLNLTDEQVANLAAVASEPES